MKLIGFSTGSLAKSDFAWAVQILNKVKVNAIELSALRYKELHPLIKGLDRLDLRAFKYISFHAPSDIDPSNEKEVVDQLQTIKERGWPIVVHPDVIRTKRYWKTLNGHLCIENMDIRKPTGRTREELEEIFADFPKSKLCFDIAHAKQIDGTMSEAAAILDAFHDRIRQIHISDVNCSSVHSPINMLAIRTYQKVMPLIPENVPVILESPSIDGEDSPELRSWIRSQISGAREAVGVS